MANRKYAFHSALCAVRLLEEHSVFGKEVGLKLSRAKAEWVSLLENLLVCSYMLYFC